MNKLILVTQPNCRDCIPAKAILDDLKIEYDYKNAVDNMDFCGLYGIASTPTLIEVTGETFKKHPGLANIETFINDRVFNKVEK